MSLFPEHKADALYFSMDDASELMSRNSPHAFHLDNENWPTVEHYYQAMKFQGADYQTKINKAQTAIHARQLGKTLFKKKRHDFKQVRTTLMTRAVYIQAKTHAEIQRRIIATEQRQLVENSQFDYYWGCGRDHRGDNHYGQVVMNVRQKLLDELKQNR